MVYCLAVFYLLAALPENEDIWGIFNGVLYVCIFLSEIWTNVLVVLPSFYPCSWHAADPVPSSAGTLVLWFFSITIPSVTAISSLIDQYGCTSFQTLDFVGGQLHIRQFACTPICLSSRVTYHHVFWDVNVCFYCIYAYAAMPGISSLFILWLCLDRQAAINNCELGLYRILMLYWWIHSSIFCNLFDRFDTSFLKFSTSGLWSVITLTLWLKQ